MKKLIKNELIVIEDSNDYKSYWCPDREHVFEMELISNSWFIRISLHGITIRSLTISTRRQDLIDEAKKLACKHYPSKI